MPNGFVVTEKDWEHFTPAQQSWMTFNAVQEMDKRVKDLEKRPLIDKALSFSGGVVGGIGAIAGKWFFFRG